MAAAAGIIRAERGIISTQRHPLGAMDKSGALLPGGFSDLLPPDAEREFAALSILMKTFAGFGYRRVKPPLLEFEDSLFAPGPGAAMAGETFRLMDPLSHKMMGLRSDITVQIARIASTRMEKEPRPLRLTYANDVLRTKAGQQRTERQFCQAGCELVGDAGDDTDMESCMVALAGLKALGIEKITIDLAFPPLAKSLLAQSKDRDAVRKLLDRRDESALRALKTPAGKTLAALLQYSGPGEKALKGLEKLALKGEGAKAVKKLRVLHDGLTQALKEYGLDGISITVDAAETRGFDYKTGFAFTLFAKGVAGALGRGGRYDIGSGKNAESAAGFTLYMDTVRKAMPPLPEKKAVSVGYGESWKKIKELQRGGAVVVRGKRKGK